MHAELYTMTGMRPTFVPGNTRVNEVCSTPSRDVLTFTATSAKRSLAYVKWRARATSGDIGLTEPSCSSEVGRMMRGVVTMISDSSEKFAPPSAQSLRIRMGLKP